MSTRSVTSFCHKNRVVANIYRHYDGFPSTAGVDIKNFLQQVAVEVNDTRFTDPSYLAAKYVVFLADLFHDGGVNNNLSKFNFLSVGIVQDIPGDVEYLYKVDCSNIDANGFPVINAYRVYEDSLSPVSIP